MCRIRVQGEGTKNASHGQSSQYLQWLKVLPWIQRIVSTPRLTGHVWIEERLVRVRLKEHCFSLKLQVLHLGESHWCATYLYCLCSSENECPISIIVTQHTLKLLLCLPGAKGVICSLIHLAVLGIELLTLGLQTQLVAHSCVLTTALTMFNLQNQWGDAVEFLKVNSQHRQRYEEFCSHYEKKKRP